MENKIPVAILGATGSVGQRFIQLLDGHPWFEVVALTGSERTAGLPYREACHWILPGSMPTWPEDMTLVETDPAKVGAPVCFSALPSGEAALLEERFARNGQAVVSNASAHRKDGDVPILLPEVNPDHARLVSVQREQRGWKGCIVTNPNCTSTGLTVALKALQDEYGLRGAFVVSLQALSGAGYPGVPSLDIIDNVIPYIAEEEEKLAWEPRKMLGNLAGGQIVLAEAPISAHTNRVAVQDAHLVCLTVALGQRTSPEEAARALAGYNAPEVSRDLPSAPRPPILVRREPDRPQPRLDRDTGQGMTTVVGRLRPDPIFDLRMVILSHNTIRGAAGGAIYNAELLVEMSLI